MNRTLRFSLWAILILIAPLLHAADYYVSTDGSDSNDGSDWANAFLTIQKAVNTASSGDAIYVSDREASQTDFSEEVNIPSGKDGLQIIGDDDEGNERYPVLNGGETLSKAFTVSSDNVTIKYFTIIDYTNGGNYANGAASGIYVSDETIDHVFDGNKIDNCGWGIYAKNTSNTQIISCEIGNVSGAGATTPGIHYSGGNGGTGIALLSTGEGLESNIVGGSGNANTIKSCDAYAVLLGGHSSEVSADLTEISYNSITSAGNSTTSGFAIKIDNVEDQITISDNTFTNCYNVFFGDNTIGDLYFGDNTLSGTSEIEAKMDNSFGAGLMYDVWKNNGNTIDGGSAAALHATNDEIADNADGYRYIRVSIADAVGDAASNERIYANAGNYTENVTANKALTFEASGAVTITGNFETQSGISFNAAYTIDGNLTLNGGDISIGGDDLAVTGTITPNSNIIKTDNDGYLAYPTVTNGTNYVFPLGDTGGAYKATVNTTSSSSNPLKAKLLGQTPNEKRKGDDRLAIGQVWDFSGDGSLGASVKLEWPNSSPPVGSKFDSDNTFIGLGNAADWIEQTTSPTRTSSSLEISSINTFSDMAVFSWEDGAAGYYAQQDYPDVQARSVVFTSVNDTEISFRWVNGNGSNVLVAGKEGGLPDSPVNGEEYSGNSDWASANTYGTNTKVLYRGSNSANSLTVTNLSPAKTYYFEIFSFNGSGDESYYSSETGSYNPRSRATKPKATLNSALPAAVCENDDVDLSITVEGNTGPNNIKVVYSDGVTNTTNTDHTTLGSPFTITHDNISSAAGSFNLISVRDRNNKVAELYGNPQTVTVTPSIEGNTLSNAQTICAGGDPSAIDGSTPTGGNGSYTYSWEQSTSSANDGFVAASGTNNLEDYDPGVLSQTTWYRREVTSGNCTDVSSAIEITVNPVIANNTMPSAQTICSGDTPSSLDGSTPTGGNGSYSYQWESSTDGTTFSDISGATSEDYSPGALTQDTWYRREVTSGPCTDLSASVKITVNPVIANNTMPSAQTICSGDTPSSLDGSTPTGGNGSYTYQWESSTDGTTFSDISGATSEDYSPGALTQDTWYRREVTSGPCTDISASVKITVHPVIADNTMPSAQTICSGDTPSSLDGSTPTGGNGSYTYQWESSTDGTSFSDISGATSEDYSPGALTQDTWYRREVTSGPCTDVSASVKITVHPVIADNTMPSAQTICSGDTPSSLDGSTPTGGDGSYTYQWESSTDGTTFSDISGATSEDYSPGALTQDTWYRREVTSGPCTDMSASVKITVNPVIANNTMPSAQEICSGDTPASLDATSPTGGNGSYTYQWESSTDGTTFSDISGATSEDYSPGALTQDTWYRREVTSGPCTDVSASVKITVHPVIADNTMPSAQTICSGDTPTSLDGSTPTGGNGSYSYQWESSTDGTTFSDISGATSEDYSPGALTQDTWYRREVISGPCTDLSASVKISVNPVIADNTMPSAQTICSGDTPTSLDGSTPIGGNGSYSYQWESSTDGTTFSDISGATNEDYSPGALTQDTWYRREVTSGPCTDISASVKITVNPVIADNSMPSAQTICSGDTPSSLDGSTPTGGNGSYTYQWESSTDGTTFSDISGATSEDYSPGALTQDTWYRREVTSGPCTDVSASVKITVHPVIADNTMPSVQTICSGDTPTSLDGSTPTGGNGSYTYQWESSTDGTTFSDISGATSGDYSPGALTQDTWYRREVTSGPCTDVSASVKITVNPVIADNTMPSAQTICSGDTPTSLDGSTPTGGDGSYTYQWESSTDGTTFSDISGATSEDYSPGALTQDTWYRREVTSGPCTDVSASVKITVYPVIADNTMPSAQTICSGDTPSSLDGSTPTGGNGSYSYQWESSTDGTTFSDISGATSEDYSPGALTQDTWYRREVTSGPCTDMSASVEITVNPVITNNTMPSAQTICSGDAPSSLDGSTPTGGNGSYTYKWESSTDGTTFSDISGATSEDYSPGALTQDTWYRREVTSGPCTDVSASVKITVNPVIANNTMPSAQEICSGDTPASLDASTPTGGNGSYSYQWESSTDGTTFSDISGATSEDYSPGALTQDTWYRREVTSGPCADVSASVKISVNPVIADNTMPSAQTICSGDTPSSLDGSTPTGGNGSYTYQWESSTDGITFSDISGATSEDYSPGALTQDTWYRRGVTSSGCSDMSASVKITVNPVITNNTMPSAQTICSGDTPASLDAATPTGGNGTYTYQWESSTDGTTFSDISGATSEDYSPDALTQDTWYRREVTSGPCTDVSASVKITVHPVIADNTMPSAQTICSGDTPSSLDGSTPTGGNGSYSYQWESSTDGTTFSDISGATSEDYSPGALTQDTWYRREVTSGPCTDMSASVNISVNPVIADNTMPSAQTICSGDAPSSLDGSTPTGGNGSYSYQWESSTDGTTFSDISGATSEDYSPGALTQDTWYRREVTSGPCTDVSASVKITVHPVIADNTMPSAQEICSGDTPASLDAATPTGGNGSYTYQWESSTDGTTFSDISGATSEDYSPGALTQDTWYRREVTSGPCTDMSASVKITVHPVIADNTMPSAQTICSGDTPTSLDGSTPTGGNGSYTYKWESSTDGTTFSDISGATSEDYSPGALTQDTWYRREVTSGPCTDVSASVKITVNPVIADNTMPSAQEICSGDTPASLDATSPTGGNGSYTYQWESSTDGTTFSDISGATSEDYSPGSLTQDTWYRREVTSGPCTDVSASVKITVHPVIADNTMPSAQTICSGDTPSSLDGSTPTGGNGSYSYQWESSTDGTTFSDISGATSEDYSPGALTQDTWYRREVTSGPCTDMSASVKISVNPVIADNTMPSAQTICSGDTPSSLDGSTPTGGNGSYTYKWESSTDGTTFSDISGATSEDYSPGALTQDTWYRREVTSGPCTDVSASVKITVHTVIADNTMPSAQEICSGDTPASLDAATPTGGNGSYTYQWESSTDGTTFSDISGATSEDYSPGALTQDTWYRREVTSGPCTDMSASVKITVHPVIADNTMPSAQTICSGDTPTSLDGSTPTGGNGSYTYQWESSTDGTTFSDISGAASEDYSPGALTQDTWYRREVTSGPCTDVSASMKITVHPVIADNTMPSAQEICSGDTPSSLDATTPTGGDGSYAYQWESSTDGTTFSDISGATSEDYSPGALTQDTWYRREVTSGPCTDISASVKITVNPVIADNSMPSAQTICSGDSPSSLDGSTPTGGNGSYTYQWESSTDGTTFSDISGATTEDYSPGALTQDTWYRREVTSGPCTDLSASVKISVNPVIADNTMPTAQTICSGDTPTSLDGSTPTGGNGSYSYQWESSTDGTTFSDISGATSEDYSPGALTQDTWYRREVTSGPCTDVSASVKITVHPVIADNTMPSAQEICSGDTPASLDAATPTGGNGSYTYQWESSTDGTTFSDISGATSEDYSPGALTQDTWYRREVTSGPCADVSASVKITVNPVIADNTMPSAQTICSGDTPTSLDGSTPTGGNGSYTYQWESSTDGTTFSDISGATSEDYSPGALTQDTWYRREVTSGGCTDVSASVKISVHPVIANNTMPSAQTICSGDTPTSLDGSTPTGGDGSYTYQWESSTDGTTFSDVSGATSEDYSPGALTQDTWYRREVTSNGCSDMSASVKITVHPVIADNTMPSAQTICSGDTPSSLDGSTPTGGDGSYTYQWESSTDGTTFSDISGATSEDYSPGALTQDTWYRREVTSGPCTDMSASVKITVNPVIANNTMPSAQTICSGDAPSSLDGSTPTGGNGSYSYQWESSTDGTTFSDISGATSEDYSPGALTQDTWYRREVTSGPCTDMSASVKITVHPVIADNTMPSAQTICSGDTPASLDAATPTGGSGSYTYQWESSTDGTTFSDVSGATSEDYSPGALTQDTWYRREVSSGPCTDVSASVKITVNPVIADNTMPSVQTICSGDTPASLDGSTPTGGNGSYSYQWESSTDGTTFSDISGATNEDYSPGALTQDTWYRREVTSGGCTDVSASVKISVHPVIANNTMPSAQTICSGDTPTSLDGSTPTGGDGSYTYQWESSTDGTTFSDVSGATSEDYSPGALTQDTWYRREVTSNGCSDMSASVKITVHPVIADNTMPSAQTICSGDTPSSLDGSTPTGGNGSYTYQWESSTDGTTFSDISGATSEDYSPGALTQDTWYRREVTSGPCADLSASVKITVNPVIANNTMPSAQTICSGDTPTSLDGSTPTGGNGSYTYQWESSTDGTTFSDISGATSEDYSPGALTQDTWYRREVTSGPCTDVSASVKITVHPVIADNTMPSAQTICSGDTPASLDAATPTGGNGSYTYQWESSTDGTTFSDVSGATSEDYSPGALTQDTWYRREVSSGPCTDVSASVKITVNPVIADNTMPSAQTICSGDTPTSLDGSTPTGGNGSYTYQWESSTDGTIFSDISGATNEDYSPGALTQDTWYRREVTSGGCTDVSASVKISVHPVIANNTMPSAQTICSGDTPAGLDGSTPTGGNGSYTYQWESSTDGTTFSDISGATSEDYSPGALTQDTWYRREVTSNGCSDMSASVKITVHPVIADNTMPSAQTICSGDTPSSLDGSTPTGGNGSYSYQWESSTDGTTFSDISGATSEDYSPGGLTQDTWYRREVTSGPCTDMSASVKITVNPVIANNTMPSAQTICSGDAPSSLDGSTPTGGNGSYSYQWESSTDGTTFGDISGATSEDYSPGALTQDTWYRREVTSGPCTDVSASVKITVHPVIADNTMPSAQEICSGDTPASLDAATPTGGNGSYTYQWESSTDGTTFSDISGATSEDYSPGALTQDTWYRREVTSGPCADVSASVKITVNPVIADNTMPSAQTICSGDTPTSLDGSTPTGGNGSYTYQWESSTDGTTFSDISGATSEDYSPGALTQDTWYRREVTSGGCTDVSASVKISVHPVIANNTMPSAQTICSGDTPSSLDGSTPTGGDGSYTYQWESSTDGTTFSDVSGATSEDYSPGALTQDTWYRREVTSNGCSDMSASVKITVHPVIADNTMPSAQTICSGDTPSSLDGSTPTGGNGSYTYQWESSTDGTTFSDISGATSEDYSPGALTQDTWYRREVTSGPCTDMSASVKITVNPVIANNTMPSAQTICSGDAPSSLDGSTPTGGNGSYTYQWESSTDGTTFSDISGATSEDYSPGALTQDTWYRREVTSGQCTDLSASVKITVHPVISNNTMPAPQDICSGETPAILDATTPTGGDGTYSYQWESSIDGSNYSFLSGATNEDYSPGALSEDTWYRRQVSSNGCTDISSSVKISVTPAVTNNSASSAQVICEGETPIALDGSIPSGGDGSYAYLWESSTTSASDGFSSASGSNNLEDYSPGTLNETTWFRRIVSSGACEDYTAAVKITVHPAIANNTIGINQLICEDETPSALNGSTPTGGDGAYDFLWEYSTTSGSSGFSAAGGTNNEMNYSPGSLSEDTWFRRKVTSGACSDYSAAIKITVTPLLANNNVSSAQSICEGSTPAPLSGTTPAGGSGSYAYEWQSSTTSSISGFSPAFGTNDEKDYSPGALTQTTWFRRVVVSGGCENISPAVEITVTAAIASNTASSNQTICSGETPEGLTGSTPTGGNGVYAYQWQSSTVSSSSGFATASGAYDNKNYSPGALNETTWFRRVVTSGVCTDISGSVQITVNSKPSATIMPSPYASYCEGSDVELAAPQNANYSYQWKKGGSDIPGATDYNYFADEVGNYTVEITDDNTLCSALSAATQVTQTGSMPGVPGGLASSNVKALEFKATWTAVSGASGYYVDVATDENFTSFVSGYQNKQTGINSLTVNSGLARGTQYYFRVRAFNGCGTSSNSSSASAVTLDPDITVVASDPFNFGDVIISQCAGSAQSFAVSASEIEADLTITPPAGFKLSLDGTNFIYTNSSPLTLNKGINGSISNTTVYAKFCPDATGSASGNITNVSSNADTENVSVLGEGILAAPAQPYATTVKSDKFTMNWFAVNGATGYKIDVATDAGFTNFAGSYNNLDVGNVFSSTIVGLTRNTTYYFRVKAYDGNGTYGNSVANNVDTYDPVITVTDNAPYNFGSVTVSTCSGSPKQFTVSASELDGNLILTPPEQFKLSLNGTTFDYDNSNPLSIAPGGNGDIASTVIYIEFCPASSGSFSGNISLASTNADTKYVAVQGTGAQAAPGVQASAIVYSDDQGTSIDLSWAQGDGEKKLVVMRVNGQVTWAPVNGVEYTAGQNLGNGHYVVAVRQSGDTQEATISSNISAGDDIWVKIWEYNGSGSATSYLKTGFAAGSNPHRPLYLNVTNANNNNSIVRNTQFFMTVESQDRSGDAANANSNVSVTMEYSGGGLENGVIVSGNSKTTIYETISSAAGTGKSLSFTATGYFGHTHNFTLFEQTPTQQCYYILFNSKTCTSVNFRFFEGNGSKEVVFYKEGGQPGLPVDGVDYTSGYSMGDEIADGTRFAWAGDYSGGNINLAGLTEGANVYIRAYTYNGDGSLTNYNKSTAALNPRNTILPMCRPAIDVAEIGLSDYTASSSNSKVYTEWGTYLESGILGFEVYKAKVDAQDTHEPDYKLVSSYLSNPALAGSLRSYGKGYGLVDDDPALRPGDFYIYRLVYVGIDGAKMEAGEKLVEVMSSGNDGNILFVSGLKPQPASNYLTFNVELKSDANVSVSVYELSGRQVMAPASNKHFRAGVSEMKLEFDETVSSGTYILHVSAGGETVTKTIVINK